MEFKRQLELVHLQITKSCNLRCYFCGQWGQEGFFSQAAGTPLTREEWFGFMEQLAETFRDAAKKPSVILWGGEPLCCEFFDEAAQYLYEQGFALGLITNGTLLERHAQVCDRCFRKIYISVDGPPEVHDKIRGEGVFEKVRSGREKLDSCQITVMSVLTKQTVGAIRELVDALSVLRPDQVILQQQIGMTQAEIDRYKKWMREVFHREAPYIDSWKWGEEEARKMKEQRSCVEEQLKKLSAPFPVSFLPHLEGDHRKKCFSPCRHIHIAWNGDLLYCTDFYDFTPGNIRQAGWEDIFLSQKSELFLREVQAGRCETCSHCSWRLSKSFGL